MNHIIIFTKIGKITGFEMKGHAGAWKGGRDLVCCGLSVLSQNAVMSIVEIAGMVEDEDFELVVDAKIPLYRLRLKKSDNETASIILSSFALGAKTMQETYPKYVKITYEEV